jgi:hypothetical protein
VVVKETLGDVQESIPRNSQLPERDFEIPLRRFVAADLLRRNYRVKFNGEALSRTRKEIVVDVG